MRLASALALALLLAGCAIGPRETPVPYYEALVQASPFTDLVVEIDHAPGYAPSDLAKEHLLRELRKVTGKTSVLLRVDASLAEDPSRTWSSDELVALEAQTRSTTHAAPVAVLHVLYPAGTYEKPGVAGITISGTGIGPVTVFLDTLGEINFQGQPLPQPTPGRDELERSTLLHEAGHAMGLVNNGLRMVRDHEDKEHPAHSSNKKSVMYWSVDSLSGMREALLHEGSIPIFFDSDDRADLRTVGGR